MSIIKNSTNAGKGVGKRNPAILSVGMWTGTATMANNMEVPQNTKNRVAIWLSHPTHVHQFSSVTQSCPTLCDPMDRSTPGFPVRHQLPELIQTHVHQVGDAIQPSHPLLPPSPFAFNLFQHQSLFKWVSSSHQVAKVLELQVQHQSFQRIFRTDFL